MNYDEMLEVWRAQDETPPYRVNPGLLQVVVWQEQAALRRQLGLGWFVPCMLWVTASAMLAVVVGFLFVLISIGQLTPTMWDYLATGIAIGMMLLWPVAFLASYKRQPPHERGFGNSLQEEIQRNLAWVDYKLSRYGQLATWLLNYAPFVVTLLLFFWVGARMSDNSFGSLFIFISVWPALLPMFLSGGYYKKRLLALRRRLTELLELLDAGEWKPSEWEWKE
jgi:hypothetical protein